MTEITQADRDAAAQYDVVEAFARHRKYGYDQGYYDGRKLDGEEERAAIVAWLRGKADEYDSGHRESWPTIDSFNQAAIAIEAGKHLK